MEPQSNHQEGADALGRGARVSPRVRHALQNFIGDLAVFTHGTGSLQDRKQRLEGIPVNTGDAADLPGALQGVVLHSFARGVPVEPRRLDFGRTHKAIDRDEPIRKVRALAKPTGFVPRERRCEKEHLGLPSRKETAPALSPLDIPVPDGWKNEMGER